MQNNMPSKVFIIAEAGVNHNGSLDMALKLIDAAVSAGADAIKFQTFKSELLVCANAPKAEYQISNTGSSENQLEMLKKLELKKDDFVKLQEHCSEKNIVFISSPFDLESVEFLQELGVEILKIPSGEITNLPYMEAIGRSGRKIIMSTGMCTLEETGKGLDVLIKSGTSKDDITVMHCTTEYPALYEDVNLRAIQTIAKEFDVKTGYSDHTPGMETAIAAVGMGACAIEKHMTLDKKLPGPDHKASLDPVELRIMTDAIRKIEKAMGDGIKKPSPLEMKNMAIVRKSIVALRQINKGEMFSADNITCKRPGTGVSPMRWHEIIGKTASRNYSKDEMIEA